MNGKEKYIKKLKKYREEINKLDYRILELLNARGNLVIKVGEIKRILELGIDQPQREKEIIEGIRKMSSILKPKSIEAIWTEIINACKLIQE